LPADKQADTLHVDGRPFRAPSAPVFLGNSGTAMRFLSAACATLEGEVLFDGTARMRERPITDLAAALARWGVEAHAPTGCPPLRIRSTGRFGGATSVRGSASSQYLSGLLLVAPRAQRDVAIHIEGELVSKPYIDLTLDMMSERGIKALHEDYQTFHVAAGQRYAPGTYAIEADASGASYFFAAAAVAGGRVRVLHLTRRSSQGDARFPWLLERMGCRVAEGDDWTEVTSTGFLEGIEADLNAMPDMAQTLAVVALFAKGPTVIRNVANLRIKETDRIAATAVELRKLGAEVEEWEDGFRITPGPLCSASIATYDDHRMAMSFAVAGLRIPGMEIQDPGCTAKTFPDFFERFALLR
jgi:3-phosphoshikimate 1-carboxyvinyltransferase